MRKLFTIGELATLFNIQTTKIRFYERKGLLKPTEIDENGYRLYSFKDLEQLELILLFRDMDVSLERIKELIIGYKPEDYKELLLDLKKETKQQIKKLKQKQIMLDERLSHLETYKHNDMKVIEYPERKYVLVEQDILTESNHEKQFFESHNKLHLKLSNYTDKYVIIVNDDLSLDKGVINERLLKEKKNVFSIPAGKYLEIKRKISIFSNNKENMKSLIKDINNSGYQIEGTLYGIEDYRLFLFSNISEYYTFEIKIKD